MNDALPANILEAIDDPRWWRRWFDKGDWSAWRAFLCAVFGLPMTEAQAEVYRASTGRTALPAAPVREAWAICGRRAGKTRIMALVAAWLAIFVKWHLHLAPGEKATIMLLASDRAQARNAMRYLRSLFLDHPGLKKLIVGETQESLELTNRVVIEVATASFRSVRGYSVAALIADELAFWRDSETSSNPAEEILAAVKPAMATLPGSLLMVASSPYSKRGPLWNAYRRHYGKDSSVLVWKAATRTMNPSVEQALVDEAMREDPARASAEYLAGFRSDIEAFVTREAVEACIALGIRERAPMPGVTYSAFVDPSGGSADSMTLCIAHREADVVIIDAIRERRPPFSPDEVSAEFAAFLKSYGISKIVGDKFAGGWPVERFAAHAVTYEQSAKPKSDLYQALLPAITSRQVELLDDERLVAQLVGLERRTSRGGRDNVDHATNAHDDVANAVAGAVASLAGASSYDSTMKWVSALGDWLGAPADGRRPIWSHPDLAARRFL